MARDSHHKTTLEIRAERESGEYMNEKAFEHIIRESDFSAHTEVTVEALRLVFVEGLKPIEAQRRTGATSGLTKAVQRFKIKAAEYNERHGIVHKDWFLSPPFAALADYGEYLTLNGAQQTTEASKRIDKLAQELSQEINKDKMDNS